jgi:hypothetical protein
MATSKYRANELRVETGRTDGRSRSAPRRAGRLGPEIAQRIAYGNLASGLAPDLEQSYEDAAAQAEEVQLEKAGVRLAIILTRL